MGLYRLYELYNFFVFCMSVSYNNFLYFFIRCRIKQCKCKTLIIQTLIFYHLNDMQKMSTEQRYFYWYFFADCLKLRQKSVKHRV